MTELHLEKFMKILPYKFKILLWRTTLMFNIFHVDDINSMKCINVVSRKSNEAVLLNWNVILVLIFVDPVYCTFNSNFESFAKANAVTTRLRKKLIFTKMEYLVF